MKTCTKHAAAAITFLTVSVAVSLGLDLMTGWLVLASATGFTIGGWAASGMAKLLRLESELWGGYEGE